MDAIVVSLSKPNGGNQVVEIVRNPGEEHQRLQGVKSHGNPKTGEFLLVVHEDSSDQPDFYFILNPYVGILIKPGDDFLSGSHQLLAEVFDGSVIEKVVGFSEPV